MDDSRFSRIVIFFLTASRKTGIMAVIFQFIDGYGAFWPFMRPRRKKPGRTEDLGSKRRTKELELAA